MIKKPWRIGFDSFNERWVIYRPIPSDAFTVFGFTDSESEAKEVCKRLNKKRSVINNDDR
jgi:hypothetical protein